MLFINKLPQINRQIKFSRFFSSYNQFHIIDRSKDSIEYDLLVVGGGISGLSTAISAKQTNSSLKVCVLEKGANIGDHVLSGNVFDTVYLNELIKDWKDRPECPVKTKVVKDEFKVFWDEEKTFNLPHSLLPKTFNNVNDSSYIISLSAFSNWLSTIAEDEYGIEIFSGFSADKVILDKYTDSNLFNGDYVAGVLTKETGVSKNEVDHRPSGYEEGLQILAKHTVFAEGCRGSCSEALLDKFDLKLPRYPNGPPTYSPQSYGIGIKEVWRLHEDVLDAYPVGTVIHSVGYPLERNVYGGSFIYIDQDRIAHIGIVIGLDYENPYLSPYGEFNKWKSTDFVSSILRGGECISYGARALNEGGWQSIPRLFFPGGNLVGDCAGFLNVPRVKGAHNAMKTGIEAGRVVGEIFNEKVKDLPYLPFLKMESKMIKSIEPNVLSELKSVRNVKPSFSKFGGLWGGMLYSGISLMLFRGKEPWTFTWDHTDASKTEFASDFKEIVYPKPDGKITFDINDSLVRAGVSHEHDQPSHLRVKDGMEGMLNSGSFETYGAPETRFCPAKVYEIDPDHPKRVIINAQNCIHCKTCSIKTPSEYIQWTVPEGGGGPAYNGM